MDRNEGLSNALGMFVNAFLAGLVATVIPALIASIDTVTGAFNASWEAILAGLVVNALTALVLAINEYLRSAKGGERLGYSERRGRRVRGFLPY